MRVATLVGLFLLFTQPLARAAELHVWTARAGATVLEEIGPEFERATGHKLVVTARVSAEPARARGHQDAGMER
jgi:hypothetical protein